MLKFIWINCTTARLCRTRHCVCDNLDHYYQSIIQEAQDESSSAGLFVWDRTWILFNLSRKPRMIQNQPTVLSPPPLCHCKHLHLERRVWQRSVSIFLDGLSAEIEWFKRPLKRPLKNLSVGGQDKTSCKWTDWVSCWSVYGAFPSDPQRWKHFPSWLWEWLCDSGKQYREGWGSVELRMLPRVFQAHYWLLTSIQKDHCWRPLKARILVLTLQDYNRLFFT